MSKIPGPYVPEPPNYWDDEEEVRRKSEEPPPAWTEETTQIVRRPKDHFVKAADAMRYFHDRYGWVFQNLSTARWWAARVKK